MRGRTLNATAQNTAPGIIGSRSRLSSGPEVTIAIANAIHAQPRIKPRIRYASGIRVRERIASKPRPTSHHAGKQKNRNVRACQVFAEKNPGCVRKYEIADSEIGAPNNAPGKLRFRIVVKRRSHASVSETSKTLDRTEPPLGAINPSKRLYIINPWNAGSKIRTDQMASSTKGRKAVKENFFSLSGFTNGSVPQVRMA